MNAVKASRPGNDSTSPAVGRITRGRIDVGGRPRSYTLVEAPGGTKAGASLVLIFHGSKQTGEKFRAFTGNSFDALAVSGGAVVAYLDGYRAQWNDARAASGFAARTENIDDVAFAEAVVSELAASRAIDRSKVYAAGFSNGGELVIRLIHQVPGLLAGGAVIGATQPSPDNFLLADAPAAALPVLLIHGTRDPLVSYAGGAMRGWVRWVFKVGGTSLSAPQTAAYFAARNSITEPPSGTDLPHRGKPGETSVTRTDYRQDGRFPVTLYTVHGGGHTVPGPHSAPFVLGRTSHDLNAAEAIGEFFGLLAPSSGT